MTFELKRQTLANSGQQELRVGADKVLGFFKNQTDRIQSLRSLLGLFGVL